MYQREKDPHQNEDFLMHYIKYHNYSQFQNDEIIDHCFYYLHLYHYDKLIELILKKKEKWIEKILIQHPDIRTASNGIEIEVIYYFLLKIQKISKNSFSGTKIKQTFTYIFIKFSAETN